MRGVHLSQYFRGRNADGLPPITSFLAAGCGFGGSCLPKDVSALIAHGQVGGTAMPLLESVIRLNREQPRRTVELLKKHWPSLTGKRVAVLGLAFKPGTSDVRESPAFPIMRELLDAGRAGERLRSGGRARKPGKHSPMPRCATARRWKRRSPMSTR